MKNFAKIISSLIFSAGIFFCFTGCPFIEDPVEMDDFTCLSAEELTAYINECKFDTTFTIVSDSFYTAETKHYKYSMAKFTAENLPGKEVTLYQIVSLFPEDDVKELPRSCCANDYSEAFYCDYYHLLYEDQAKAAYSELYEPVIQENDFLLVLTHNFDPLTAKIHFNNFDEYKNFMSSFYTCHVLVNRIYDDDFERYMNSVLYDLTNGSKPLGRTNAIFYFADSADYPCSSVSENLLAEGTFYSGEDSKVTKIIY